MLYIECAGTGVHICKQVPIWHAPQVSVAAACCTLLVAGKSKKRPSQQGCASQSSKLREPSPKGYSNTLSTMSQLISVGYCIMVGSSVQERATVACFATAPTRKERVIGHECGIAFVVDSAKTIPRTQSLVSRSQTLNARFLYAFSQILSWRSTGPVVTNPTCFFWIVSHTFLPEHRCSEDLVPLK